jgi:N-acetyltransferase 10
MHVVAGEHSIIMLSPLESPEVEGTAWLDAFVADFRQRFRALLPGAFREFAPGLGLSILDPRLTWDDQAGARDGNGAVTGDGATVTKADGSLLTAWDLSRLEVWLFGFPILLLFWLFWLF